MKQNFFVDFKKTGKLYHLVLLKLQNILHARKYTKNKLRTIKISKFEIKITRFEFQLIKKG